MFIPGLGFVVMVEVAERQRHPAQELINTQEVSVEDSEDNFRCVALARDPSEPLILLAHSFTIKLLCHTVHTAPSTPRSP